MDKSRDGVELQGVKELSGEGMAMRDDARA